MEQHHIILISLDALRHDGLGCYGNPRLVSPNLDLFSKEYLIFRNATTPATWTLPAHMSMLSGLEPPVHGCVSSRYRNPPETLPFPLVFELVEQAGYQVLSIVGGGYMEPQFGFGRGLKDARVIHPIEEALNLVTEHASSAALTFSFLHTYTVHDYPRVASSPKLLSLYHSQADPGYAGFFPTDRDFHALVTSMGLTAEAPQVDRRDLAYIRDLYDAAINVADLTMGAFLTGLKQRGLWDSTTLIITSDHGESLGEVHLGVQHWHHGGPPYQHQLKIPLLLRPARALRQVLEPGVVQAPVSLIDLVPTILDLVQQPYGRDDFDGSSLLELAMGQVAAFETRRLFFHSCEDSEDRYLDPRLFGSALTWREGKVIYDPRTRALREYYHLEEDPHEQHNRIDELDQEELKRIDEVISEYIESVARRFRDPQSLPIDDPLLLERLADLGYINLPGRPA